jgi:DNA polymerase I-like protein with 3'-5' exonuclease and polymerase domains
MLEIFGRHDADLLVISGYPTIEDVRMSQTFSDVDRLHYEFLFKRAGIDFENICVINCYDKYFKTSQQNLDEYSKNYILPMLAGRKALFVLGVDAAKSVDIKFTKINEVRGKIIKVNDIPTVVSINPFFLREKPDEIEDIECDLALLKRCLENDGIDVTNLEHPIKIVDLKNAEDIEAYINRCIENNIVNIAYDTETTDKRAETAKLISLALYAGEVDENNVPIVHYWCGYEYLKPLYSNEELEDIKKAFIKLFTNTNFKFIAHNAKYDDWVMERNLNVELPQSTYDTMEMKWVCDKDGRHGLKECVARYEGYPDYEAPIKPYLAEIKSRRNRILEAQDIEILKMAGYSPIYPVAPNKPKWNPELDKGFAMYALLPPSVLRKYNCYDTLFTFKLFLRFSKVIFSDKRLVHSMHNRREIGKEFMRCEQHGMYLDLDMNWDFSQKTEEISNACLEKMNLWLYKEAPNFVGMKPNSNPKLTELLYGEPIYLPHIIPIKNERAIWSNRRIEEFHKLVYKDYSTFSNVKNTEDLNFSKIEEFVKSQALKYDNSLTNENLRVEYKPIYCRGRYKPVAFSKKTGKPSCGVAALQLIAQVDNNPFITLMLMYRRASKIKSTFLDGVRKLSDANHIVRPRMNQVGTASGRGSSSNPNGQNFIKWIRGQFTVNDDSLILDFDLSQAEIRMLAAESGDEALIEAARQDIHTSIAKRIFPGREITSELRRQSKTTVFGIIYGIGPDKLAASLNITLGEAQDLIEFFKIAFPKAAKWMEKQVEELKSGKNDYYVWTAFGTRRLVRSILSTNPAMRSHAERVAMNSPIQGDAGEYTFWIIVEAAKQLRKLGIYDKCRMFNTTHDSVSCKVAKDLLELEKDEQGNYVTENGCDYKLIGGQVYDIYNNLISNPAPVEPLNIVVFKADFEVRNRWSAKPDLLKALDPREDMFNWDLIKNEEIYDDEEGELEFIVQ